MTSFVRKRGKTWSYYFEFKLNDKRRQISKGGSSSRRASFDYYVGICVQKMQATALLLPYLHIVFPLLHYLIGQTRTGRLSTEVLHRYLGAALGAQGFSKIG